MGKMHTKLMKKQKDEEYIYQVYYCLMQNIYDKT